jgi:hypothetical protein
MPLYTPDPRSLATYAREIAVEGSADYGGEPRHNLHWKLADAVDVLLDERDVLRELLREAIATNSLFVNGWGYGQEDHQPDGPPHEWRCNTRGLDWPCWHRRLAAVAGMSA